MKAFFAVVTEVLLADGWHKVRTGTYTADTPAPAPRHRGRSRSRNQGPGQAPGFVFTALDGSTVTGPLTSVLAVRATPPVVAEVVVQWCGTCNDGEPTGELGRRFVQVGDRSARCQECGKKAPAVPGEPEWCRLCVHTAARWTMWKSQAGVGQNIPCPRCHPDPQAVLTRIPSARTAFEEYLVFSAMTRGPEA
ncbi:hypothetical protein ACFV1L_21100 [Kitasatospora sp. NPDC059646]|uniref:hypothetical protein n=1 Tax=Kitasatospora sp. NPDC059646 TaxID=3346893 RepID=UPI0036994056